MLRLCYVYTIYSKVINALTLFYILVLIEIPNKPIEFRLQVHIENSLMHSCDILISFRFFVEFKVFSFLFPFASNFTKVVNDILLEED